MKSVRCFCAVALAVALAAPTVRAQGAKPGPELEEMKKVVGTWDATLKMFGQESKGTAVYKMDLGGLWVTEMFEGEMAGQKFSGKGFESYDESKKVYVGIWMDSMSASPMVMEGTYDKAKKTRTMVGEGPSMDGKRAKYKTVTAMKDDDTVEFAMYAADAKEPVFTILYKRKK